MTDVRYVNDMTLPYNNLLSMDNQNFTLGNSLISAQARYYDPIFGRFEAEDLVRDGVNWYKYSNGNPLSFVDPSGLIPVTCDGEQRPPSTPPQTL